MSERVVFRPDGTSSRVPLAELGRAQGGAWAVVDDVAWAAAAVDGDALELLFTAPAEYQHAVRGLAPEEIARVIQRRRTDFAPRIPSLALGLVELRVRSAIGALGVSGRDAGLRGDLLTALASFTIVPRFSGADALKLIDSLREGDARIIAELDSPSVRAVDSPDPSGAERAARRRFATELGELAARRGRPDKARALPYFDVERVYLLTPSSPELEQAAHGFHDPTLHFRDGLIMPIAEREIAEVEARGHRAVVVFPTRGQFMGACSVMTPAQLEVEIDERVSSPGFSSFLTALRLQQAALRSGAALIAGADPELTALLSAQLGEEATGLGIWSPGGPAAAPDLASRELRAAIDLAAFLVAFCRRRGTLPEAGNVEALGRALSHVAVAAGL